MSKLVNSLKGVSSRRLRQEYPELVRHNWCAQRPQSGPYFAGSVGPGVRTDDRDQHQMPRSGLRRRTHQIAGRLDIALGAAGEVQDRLGPGPLAPGRLGVQEPLTCSSSHRR